MKISFEVPDEYPITVLGCLFLSLLCAVSARFVVIPPRVEAFAKSKFMTEKFEEEHDKHIKDQKVNIAGFPDTGSGRYSDKLPYKSWVTFNNA